MIWWIPLLAFGVGFLLGMFLFRLPIVPPPVSGLILGFVVMLFVMGAMKISFNPAKIAEVFT
jgi:hypothetical protein